MRSLPIGATLLLALSSCDRDFPAHVSGQIVFAGAPRPGVVLALGTSMSAPIDATGRFDASYWRLNVGPGLIPLLVVPNEGRPFVLRPRRDFQLLKCGKEWVGGLYVDATRAKPARPLQVTCVASACTATLPVAARACSAEIAMLDPFAAPKPASQVRDAEGVREITFTVGKDALVVAAVCDDGEEDFVSDVMVGSAAPAPSAPRPQAPDDAGREGASR
jgi:hypothetical protein